MHDEVKHPHKIIFQITIKRLIFYKMISMTVPTLFFNSSRLTHKSQHFGHLLILLNNKTKKEINVKLPTVTSNQEVLKNYWSIKLLDCEEK
jgi:hypothetical protein